MAKKKAVSKQDTTANFGFEAKLWLAADKLHNNMDAAEYKHVVLGLIFLKYIPDTFDEHHAKLWFLTKDKDTKHSLASGKAERAGVRGQGRSRTGETLFIDVCKMGTLIDRVHRELTDADITKITSTYHAWRGDLSKSLLPRAGGEGGRRPVEGAASYEDISGFCKSASTAEVASHGLVLTPGRYLGAEEVEEDSERFDQKMQRLVANSTASSRSLQNWSRRSGRI